MNNDLISRSELKNHKFVGVRYVRIGGRTNGKILENINNAYQQGWNDCIDAIIDNAPTVERQKGKWRHYEGFLTCSVCGVEFDDDIMEHFLDDVPKYCPECGADMRGGGRKNE